MKRAVNDNDLLLHACERAHRLTMRAGAIGLGVLIGFAWYVSFVVGVTR